MKPSPARLCRSANLAQAARSARRPRPTRWVSLVARQAGRSAPCRGDDGAAGSRRLAHPAGCCPGPAHSTGSPQRQAGRAKRDSGRRGRAGSKITVGRTADTPAGVWRARGSCVRRDAAHGGGHRLSHSFALPRPAPAGLGRFADIAGAPGSSNTSARRGIIVASAAGSFGDAPARTPARPCRRTRMPRAQGHGRRLPPVPFHQLP